jgi:uncharacterized membrane protein YjdF
MKKLQLYTLLFFVGLVVSGIYPKEYFTWFLEVLPAVIGFAILAFTFKRFQFTNFTYLFILIHCYILFLAKQTATMMKLKKLLFEITFLRMNNSLTIIAGTKPCAKCPTLS